MSGSSGGVVFSNSTAGPNASRFGQQIPIAGGAAIPPGVYLITGQWSIVVPGATPTTVGPYGPGICISDGNATASAGPVNVIPIGSKATPSWPWPAP